VSRIRKSMFHGWRLGSNPMAMANGRNAINVTIFMFIPRTDVRQHVVAALVD
jgi:hypothetical protein